MNTGFVVLHYLHKVHKRKGKKGNIGYNLYTIRIKYMVIYILNFESCAENSNFPLVKV